jgi:hypothetical protein
MMLKACKEKMRKILTANWSIVWMAVIDAAPSELGDIALKTSAPTECIGRILVQRLNDDPVTAKEIAKCLTERLVARIAEGSVSRSEFLN